MNASHRSSEALSTSTTELLRYSIYTISPSPRRNATFLLTRDEDLALAEVCVLATILAVASIGNLGVALIIRQRRRKMSRMNLFILHLALTDLVVAVFQVLPQMIWEVTYRFYGTDLICKAVKYCQVLSMFASTYMLITMTYDRYLAVCHPLKTIQQASNQTYLMIAATWLFSAILSIPQLFIFSMREVDKGTGVYDCWAEFTFSWGVSAYVTWTTLSIFLIPMAILIFCYTLIINEICKNLKFKMKPLAQQEAGSVPVLASRVSSVHNISKAKIRTVKMTFIIVLTYIVCWAPFFSVQLWSVWDKNAPKEDSSNVAFTITMLLGSLSSCCNPWIYVMFNDHVLKEVKKYIICCQSCKPQLMRRESNNSLNSHRNAMMTKVSLCSSSSNSSNVKTAKISQALNDSTEDMATESVGM
ncbi:vasopressin V1b receptor-like [Polypterus senegalus]|uniref:vasopressin V1b receptor-like n=1 Tax=Polypterus senegalus TaxID=55291 RepID=UPI0019634571|nr:vasopressin V1b receptor-like [Polypterus senegalus]